MAVNVKLFGVLRVITGKDELDMEANSMREVLDALVDRYGDTVRESLKDERGVALEFLQIFVNGKLCGNMDMQLGNGDRVFLIPPIEGGGAASVN